MIEPSQMDIPANNLPLKRNRRGRPKKNSVKVVSVGFWRNGKTTVSWSARNVQKTEQMSPNQNHTCCSTEMDHQPQVTREPTQSSAIPTTPGVTIENGV
jgi:hypothetical protein